MCAPLDCQYAELPSSASDAVLCTVFVCKHKSNKILKEKKNSAKDDLGQKKLSLHQARLKLQIRFFVKVIQIFLKSLQLVLQPIIVLLTSI